MESDIAGLIREFGFPVTVLIIVLATGARGVWVWGRELRSAVAEKNEWKRIALKALNAAEKVAEKGP